MKNLYLFKVASVVPTMFLVAPLLFAQSKPGATIQDNILNTRAKELKVPAINGQSAGWYNQAVSYLETAEYYAEKGNEQHVFLAPNRAQGLGFMVTPTGYTVKNFSAKGENINRWEASFQMKGWGRQTAVAAPAFAHISGADEGNIRYNYKDGYITYENNQKGLRQNFIITEKPAGEGMLEVDLGIKTDLNVNIEKAGISLFTSNDKYHPVLRYDGLEVWDANHRTLAAHMEKKDNVIAIVVDDENAIYPVTVDPLNNAPSWTTNSAGLLYSTFNDGTLPALYGFSVSPAGRLNNDLIDDVIIGAPGYVHILNLSGGTFEIVSAGAAFVYFGHTTTGLSATPDEVLQPSSGGGLIGGAVNPALFGLSVSAAGDINGDGRGDVIIGAPGDRVSLTLVAGLGTQSVLVGVGKAYVYSGASFDGNVNTIPAAYQQLTPTQTDFNALGLALLVAPANPLFGFSVANAGDVNGDGFADVVVGSPAYTSLLNVGGLGRATVYYGSSSGLTASPKKIDATGILFGGGLDLLFGYSVSSAGDVNNDGKDDIIVGSPGAVVALLNGLTGTGGAYVFHGGTGGITASSSNGANRVLNGGGILNLVNGLYGNSVSSAGDVNNDGYDDVIVGEPASTQLFATQLVAVGKAYIHYGSSTGIQQAGATVLTSPRSPGILGSILGNLLFGFTVSGVGDVNCDGIDDVMVGEPGSTALNLFSGVLGLVNTQVASGTAYIFYGKTATGPVNASTLFYRETNALSVANLLGASLNKAGDVNGDGKNDLLVGAPNGTLNLGASLVGIVGNALTVLISTVPYDGNGGGIGKSYAFYTTCPILPVTFGNVSVEARNCNTYIHFEYLTQQNNKEFHIEYSTDATRWQDIATIVPAGNSQSGNYNYVHSSPVAGVNYYRIRQVDINGNFSYSKMITANSACGGKNLVSSYPNPVYNSHTVVMPVNAGTAEIRITDAVGKRVLNMNTKDSYNSINTQSMIPGVYMIQVIKENNVIYSQKFVKK